MTIYLAVSLISVSCNQLRPVWQLFIALFIISCQFIFRYINDYVPAVSLIIASCNQLRPAWQPAGHDLFIALHLPRPGVLQTCVVQLFPCSFPSDISSFCYTYYTYYTYYNYCTLKAFK